MLADAAPANLYVEATMLDGARKAVELAQGRKLDGAPASADAGSAGGGAGR